MLLIPEQVNQQNGGVRVGEQWYNLSVGRGNRPGYQGPSPLVVGVQYKMEINPHTFPNGDEAFFIQSAKAVGEAIAKAPAPYEAASGAAQQRVKAGAQRDERGRSIERQVALKGAVEIVSRLPEFSGVSEEDIDAVRFAKMVEATLGMAAAFDDWLSDTSVPPSQGDAWDGETHVAPDGDPGPRQ